MTVKVAVVARGATAAEALAAELRGAGAEAFAVAADCVEPAEVESARRAAEEALGDVELLVPFAGGFDSFITVAETEIDAGGEMLRGDICAEQVTVSPQHVAVTREFPR